MGNILLWRVDEQNFDPAAIEQVLRADTHFGDLRFDEPCGAVIESLYSEPAESDWTFVRLSDKLDVISLTGTSDTTLRAALILQRSLKTPLRIIDTDYSFDLMLSEYADLEELNAAIGEARG